MKSPKSLFSENDFYTFLDSNKNRNLGLEHKFNDIENKFIQLRDNKLTQHIPLTPSDRLAIALFASSTFARTKRWKEDGQQIWQDYLDMVDSLPPVISLKVKASKDYNDVVNVHRNQPMVFHLFQFVNLTSPYLFQMNCAIYETKSKPGFITSDNPCLWFDPAIINPNLPLTYFGIGSPTLNVILPISPSQYICWEENGYDGYRDLQTQPEDEKELVDIFNKMMVANCDEFIVVSSSLFDGKWFDLA